jgi:hypothetical protein
MVHILGQNTFADKLAYFRAWQKRITDANAELEKADQDFQAWMRTTPEFKAVAEKEAALKADAEKYKAELKAWAGFTDGERSSVLDMVEAIKKVQALD